MIVAGYNWKSMFAPFEVTAYYIVYFNSKYNTVDFIRKLLQLLITHAYTLATSRVATYFYFRRAVFTVACLSLLLEKYPCLVEIVKHLHIKI